VSVELNHNFSLKTESVWEVFIFPDTLVFIFNRRPLNYTEIYCTIYAAIKTDAVSHEKAHVASIRITDAIVDLHYTKLGGYDLDDKSITGVSPPL